VEDGEHGIRETGNDELCDEVPQGDTVSGEEDVIARFHKQEGEGFILESDGADLGDGGDLGGGGFDFLRGGEEIQLSGRKDVLEEGRPRLGAEGLGEGGFEKHEL